MLVDRLGVSRVGSDGRELIWFVGQVGIRTETILIPASIPKALARLNKFLYCLV